MTKLRGIDLFCGAGGTTTGAELSGRVTVDWRIGLSVKPKFRNDLIGIAYGCCRDWPHCGYYVSAAVLNVFVVLMK